MKTKIEGENNCFYLNWEGKMQKYKRRNTKWKVEIEKWKAEKEKKQCIENAALDKIQNKWLIILNTFTYCNHIICAY